MQQEERPVLYDNRVNAGRNTFFISARQARNGHYYVTITDSRRQEDGTFTQQKVIFFEESAKKMREIITEACRAVEELSGTRREKEIEEIRKTHPRAFMKWDEEEEKKLSKLFKKGTELEALSGEFGRSPGSVLARLEKMGLVQSATSGE
ncbi:hypothetical protein CSA37_10955 [Candidatus Fermentibacteria bacterium]|nr:MAG: hypothetical protein CSA37_10955 [Candidatus Fermentibacteria bacterium]